MSRKFDRESMRKRLVKKKADDEEANFRRGDAFLKKNEAALRRLGAENVTDIMETTRLLLKEREDKANKEADKAMERLLAEEGNKGKKKNRQKQKKKRKKNKKEKEKLLKQTLGSGNPIKYDQFKNIPLDGEGSDEMYLMEGGRRKKTRKKRKRRRKKGSGIGCSRPVRVTPINIPLNVVPAIVVRDGTVNTPNARVLHFAEPFDDGERDAGMREMREDLNNRGTVMGNYMRAHYYRNRGGRKKRRKKTRKKRKRRRKKRKTRRR